MTFIDFLAAAEDRLIRIATTMKHQLVLQLPASSMIEFEETIMRSLGNLGTEENNRAAEAHLKTHAAPR